MLITQTCDDVKFVEAKFTHSISCAHGFTSAVRIGIGILTDIILIVLKKVSVVLIIFFHQVAVSNGTRKVILTVEVIFS
ncbi:hypothetical protein D3C86_1650610 [compost metagenome]